MLRFLSYTTAEATECDHFSTERNWHHYTHENNKQISKS